ncbi:hypothetical protein GCM10023185_18500 [Hymenobacter saemangeumensis]|uniref:Uncharacterized protein n=1 Tax=Hymenobacter saemangeumensis TaxID=1084522 RepID=A0ABP8IBT0_9BACT
MGGAQPGTYAAVRAGAGLGTTLVGAGGGTGLVTALGVIGGAAVSDWVRLWVQPANSKIGKTW